MNHSSLLPKGLKTAIEACHAQRSKLQLFRQTPPGPILSLGAASDVEFCCALISTGIRKPWHPHTRVRGRTKSMVKGHSQDIVPLLPSQALCIWKRYYVVYSYVTGDVRVGFVFTSFHLWISTTGLVSSSKLSCAISSCCRAPPCFQLRLSRHTKTLQFFLIKSYS